MPVSIGAVASMQRVSGGGAPGGTHRYWRLWPIGLDPATESYPWGLNELELAATIGGADITSPGMATAALVGSNTSTQLPFAEPLGIGGRWTLGHRSSSLNCA